jgi:predicted regulator of Ras-like GTPase activity (Roadblock/LC7/MglB family)
MSEPLAPLRDVEGVAGSFVVNGSGAVLARDLPAVFDDDVFAEVGPRLERLFEALAGEGPVVKWSALRFSEHKLLVRPVRDGYLCILADGSASLPALRVAANLTAKRLGALTPLARQSEPPPTLRSERIPPPLPAQATTPVPTGVTQPNPAPAPRPSQAHGITRPSLQSPIAAPPPAAPAERPAAPDAPSATGDGRPKRYRIFRGRRYEV